MIKWERCFAYIHTGATFCNFEIFFFSWATLMEASSGWDVIEQSMHTHTWNHLVALGPIVGLLSTFVRIGV